MADNPFASMLNPNASRTGLWDMRMMSAANRMEAPFDRVRSYGHQGIAGNPMLSGMLGGGQTPDYSQFTYDPAANAVASRELGHYGLSPLEAGQVKQNTILPNSGFFGNHPRLSGALEAGIYGALAAHGGNTVGDSIQGTLEGMVGGQQLRQSAFNRQFAKPFEAANMMENLEDKRQKRDLQDAEIQHYRALNQKLGRPDHDFRAFGVSRNDPDIATIDNTTGNVTYKPNPLYDPSQASAGNSPEQQFFNAKRDEAKRSNTPVTSKMLGDWQQEWTNRHSPPEHAPHSLVGVKNPDGSITYKEARPGVTFPKGSVPETTAQLGAEPGKAATARQNWIKQNSGKASPIWIFAGIGPGDKDAAEKLGQWYDTNIAPSVQSAGGGGKTYNQATGQLE